MSSPPEIVEIRGLSKRFPGVLALSEVDFSLRRGEIHGLMGENGAGKSTLIKVLTGLYKQDAGEIYLDGKKPEFHSPEEAQRFGISTVYQEINLIPALSVAENIFIGREPKSFGGINWRAINSRAAQAIKKLDLHIDVTQPVASYSVAVQQLVAITRALDVSAKVLILDEPTSSLDSAEVARLFAVLRKLKEQGMAILFVTHFLDQAYEITDRITVLRNGSLVGLFETGKLPRLELIAKMLGKDIAELELQEELKSPAATVQNGKVFFEVRGMERKGSMSEFDLDINQGEVHGLAGLLGSGRTEIARLLFGIDRPQKGITRLKGRGGQHHHPQESSGSFVRILPGRPKDRGADP